MSSKTNNLLLFQIFVFLFVVKLYFCVDLTYTIKEGISPDSYVGNIATDSHVMNLISHQDSHLVIFQQLQKGNMGNSQMFYVSKKDGKLYTSQVLDAEEICLRGKECFQMLDIAVQKGSSTLRILEIKVVIQDVNDHRPEFPSRQVRIEFEENQSKGTKRSIPNAIDQDVGLINSLISYELKKNKTEPFRLLASKSVAGISKLTLVLEESLDRETADSYLLQVIAVDGGSPSKQSILEIEIKVTDVNDNPPVFPQNIYNVSIENEPSETTPIVVLSATDSDQGKNGRISYHLTPQTADITTRHFVLNEMTGQVFFMKEFWVGQDLIHDLYVEASDQGNPPLSKIVTVHIIVINKQNNAPTIDLNFVSSSKENTVEILENAKPGTFIAYVKVTDNDEGQNGEVTCHLHHEKFQLQNLGKKKYEVTLKNPLDREKEQQHDVVISCQDKGSPPLHSKSKFSIQVMDINDVEPQFTKDTFKFFVDENENSRITVGYINATDPDLGAGGKLSYSLITNNKQFLPFKINTRNGLLSAIMSLDHEFQHTYQFQVFVKDNGTPSLNNTVNVIVEVTDKNDNAPYFTFPSVKPYNLDVTYYQHHSKNITEIKAADSDSQENAFLKYEIIRGNDKQMFTINQYTGLLAFNRQLSPQNAGSYQLDIRVKDSGSPVLSATTTLFLTLTISNKTSLQILNVVQLPTEEKVHLNLVIIITVIAVTIAVFITASLSICIIRCNAHSNVAYAQALHPSNRYVNGQRHSIAPSHQFNSYQTAHISNPLSDSRELPSFGEKTHSNFPSNMYGYNVSIPPNYFTWRSAKSPYFNTKHDWREEEEEESISPGSEETDFTSESLVQLKKTNISGFFQESRNFEDQQTLNTRPLPPIPHLDT